MGIIFKQSHRFNESKHSSSIPYSKCSCNTKFHVISPSPDSKISLEPQTLPPSRNPAHPGPISGELKLSSAYLHDLESLLMRSPHPTPKIKEAHHQIKKELNPSEIFHSESSLETSRISKKSKKIDIRSSLSS